MVTKRNEIGESLKKLEAIALWFEKGSEIDVEEGLKKVREGAVLIKELKSRLAEVSNEFEEIKKELAE